jgi:hypothetical protein
LLVSKGNICIKLEETGAALGSLLARDSISPLGEKLSPTRDNVCPRERGSQNSCNSSKTTHRDTNPIYVKNLST